jgi:rhodanese-related sulfurtransferase
MQVTMIADTVFSLHSADLVSDSCTQNHFGGIYNTWNGSFIYPEKLWGFKEEKVATKCSGLLSALLILSTFLGACSNTSASVEPSTTPTVVMDTPTPLVSQPTDVFSEEALDKVYQTFLENMVSYNAITPEDLLNRLGEETAPFLIDVRSQAEVEQTGLIEGAIVVPLRDLAKAESIALLPDFETNIVVYCGTGWRCTIAMTFLVALGWQDVQALGGSSLTEWLDLGYPVVTEIPSAAPLNVAQPDPDMQSWLDELLQKLPNGFAAVTPDILNQAIEDYPDLILIDVRKADEALAEGGIENAIHIPLESLISMKEKWPSSKQAKILFYSNEGYRSTIAMSMLWTYGYVGVASLKGGFNAWVESGYPVAKIEVVQ